MTGKQSIYFLKNHPITPDVFLPYQRLMQDFAYQGQFLSPNTIEWLSCYDRDSQHLHTRTPLLVFQPATTSIIAPFIKACCTYEIPIVVRCGGTGLTGCVTASQGGVVILTKQLCSILEYDGKLGTLKVEPGVTPRQVNETSSRDGWFLPISMPTEGVAGLAGCLSLGARGYHQVQHVLSSSICSVTLVDGLGREHQDLPTAFVYGAEGMFGVLTKLDIQLTKIPQKRVVFQISVSWEQLLEKLNQLKQLNTLVSIVWETKETFILILEGDEWRVKGAFHYLEKIFNPIFKLAKDWSFHFKYPSVKREFIGLSHALPLSQIPLILSILPQLCSVFHLEYQVWSNVLEGSLHLILFSQEDISVFTKQLEKFLVIWINTLEAHQGFLVSRHGVGALFRHYMPPFFSEEELHCLKRFQNHFDPHHLFVQDHFFPVWSKSLEKVRQV